MSNPGAMSQPRPTFDHRTSSETSNMPPKFHPGAAQNGEARSPGSQYSPQTPFGQLPTNGIPRNSPGAQSPYTSQPQPQPAFPYPAMRMHQMNGPLNGNQVNGFSPAPTPPARSGTMGPPSLPANKATDINSLQDSLSGTGVNIEEEERRLTTSDFYGHPIPNSSFNSPRNSFGPYSDERSGSLSYPYLEQNGVQQSPQLSPEEIAKRKVADADWDAARQEQHPMWKMFLYGEALNEKLKQHCAEQNIQSPQHGLMVAQRPVRTRVAGKDGAARVIEDGQPILKIGDGDPLAQILTTLCLAAKERLTGLVDLSARLALERRQHSAGKVPTEWKSLAVVAGPSPGAAHVAESPAHSNPLKRTFSQANSDEHTDELVSRPHRIVDVFRKLAQADRTVEEARLAKRARRSTSRNPDSGGTPSILTPGGPETPSAMLLDSEKRPTKKAQKLAESKFSEAQQHKSANETARLATSGILGGKFSAGTKKKTYSWLSGAGPQASSGAVSTPVRPVVSAGTSAAGTPTASRPTAAQPTKAIGQWDEEKDTGIQARDVLLVLETDGKATRSLLRGYNAPDV